MLSTSENRAGGSNVSTASKKAKSEKTTAQELFGDDSDNDNAGKKTAPLISYITRRVASGFSRQVDVGKKGSHFVELKIYKCDEIEPVSPMNRWRHAIVTVKNRTDIDAESWQHISAYLGAIRKEFKNVSPAFINSYL